MMQYRSILSMVSFQALLLLWAIFGFAVVGSQADGGPGGAAAVSAAQPECKAPAFRYWIDHHTFKSEDGGRMFDEALEALGGQRTGATPLTQKQLDNREELLFPTSGPDAMDKWDVYITSSSSYIEASKMLRPGQLVDHVPGVSAISAKSNLVQTLAAHYGRDQADVFVPRSFLLPDERELWQAWIKDNAEQDAGVWLLKNDHHTAKGIKLVRTAEAYNASFSPPDECSADAERLSKTLKRIEERYGLRVERKSQGVRPRATSETKWKVAQQYIANPLLIKGRKFVVRLHAFVPPGLDPFRVYIHKAGLVNFATETFDKDDIAAISLLVDSEVSPSGHSPAGHITNHGTKRERWQLTRLRKELGEEAWKPLWDRMANTTACIVSAAVASLRNTSSQVNIPPRSAYELLGVDVLIDDNMHPWVTEVNSGPSMRATDIDPDTAALQEAVRGSTVRDMFGMMRLKERNWHQAHDPVLTFDEVETELQSRGGWLPLWHLYPMKPTSPNLQQIPWSDADLQLQTWLKSSPAYQQAIADWYS